MINNHDKAHMKAIWAKFKMWWKYDGGDLMFLLGTVAIIVMAVVYG